MESNIAIEKERTKHLNKFHVLRKSYVGAIDNLRKGIFVFFSFIINMHIWSANCSVVGLFTAILHKICEGLVRVHRWLDLINRFKRCRCRRNSTFVDIKAVY